MQLQSTAVDTNNSGNFGFEDGMNDSFDVSTWVYCDSGQLIYYEGLVSGCTICDASNLL
jgi:hypothetical protein